MAITIGNSSLPDADISIEMDGTNADETHCSSEQGFIGCMKMFIIVSLCTLFTYVILGHLMVSVGIQAGEVGALSPMPQSPPSPAVKDKAWNQVDQGIYPDARCLDGTPGAFYLSRSPSGSTKWVIYFEGGAWCPKDGEISFYTSDDDCSARAYSPKNSMHNAGRGTTRPCLPPACVSGNYPEMVHFQVRNEEQNPVAHDWNFVSVDYCDGGSFSGHAAKYTASTYDEGQSVYLNGGDILTAVLATMKDEFDTADEVIITGGSAGGLAVAIHADYIASYFPDAAKKVVVPESGIFYIRDRWDDMMKQMFVSRNVETSKLNERCVTANSGSEWQCFAYAWEALKHSKIPFYIMNSMYDLSQTPPGRYAEQQGASLWNRISSAVNESTIPSAGAFIHACHDHAFSYEGNLLEDTTKSGFQYFQTWWSAVKSGASQKTVSAVPQDTPYKDSDNDAVYCAGIVEHKKRIMR